MIANDWRTPQKFDFCQKSNFFTLGKLPPWRHVGVIFLSSHCWLRPNSSDFFQAIHMQDLDAAIADFDELALFEIA